MWILKFPGCLNFLLQILQWYFGGTLHSYFKWLYKPGLVL